VAERDDISFYLQSGFDSVKGQRWLVIRLAVGEDIVWDMLPNPAAPRSTIRWEALEDLKAKGIAPPDARRGADLHGVRIAGHPVPAFRVYVSAFVNRLSVDGVLGLDFFEQFAAVHWYPHSHRVVLSRRA
jgi:hypothetical protein